MSVDGAGRCHLMMQYWAGVDDVDDNGTSGQLRLGVEDKFFC